MNMKGPGETAWLHKHSGPSLHAYEAKGEVVAPWNRFKPSSKILILTVPRLCFFCGSFMLFLSCSCCAFVRLFINALWSPAGKGLTPWLSYVMSNCEVVTFPLLSWVRCGAWLYRFLIFAIFLTLFPNYWDNRHFVKLTEQYFKQSTYTLSATSKGTWAGLSYSCLLCLWFNSC